MNLIEKLNWRYATKLFDTEKKVDNKDIDFLKEVVRLSVSSYGLQLYKVIIISNDEIRKELRKVSWNQPQITDASHLFIFCNYTNNYDKHIDYYIEKVAQTQASNFDAIQQYGIAIKQNISNMSPTECKSWAEKQTYLALNNLLMACAEKQIDACPMEGFDKEAYNQILGLNEMGLNASVIAPVGYRSQEDEAQHRRKIRKSIEELFETV